MGQNKAQKVQLSETALPWVECVDVTYVTPTKRMILNGLHMIMHKEKVGMVGRNGVGKTTLVRLLAGEIEPTSGTLVTYVGVGYVPQRLQMGDAEATQTIAGFFAAQEILAALSRAAVGELSDADAALIGDNWDIEERIGHTLQRLGLGSLSLHRTLESLSGGELRRLWVGRAALSGCQLLLLDEPANDLDMEARAQLIAFLKGWNGGLLLVSHDRDLLACTETICELTEQGLKTFSGNYNAFVQARAQAEQALASSIFEQEKQLKAAQELREQVLVRQRKRTQKAERDLPNAGITRALVQILKERAQRTKARLEKIHAQKMELQKQALGEARARVRRENRILIPMPATRLAEDLCAVSLLDVSFRFQEKEESSDARWIFENFSLDIFGGERIALTGANGSGKTTLLKLVAGTLVPSLGEVKRAEIRIATLDQRAECLGDDRLSLVEVLQRALGTQNRDEVLEKILAHQFPLSMAERPVVTLSGGERVRAALVFLLSQREPPQLLLLDEPTNSLDLPSIEVLESELCTFEGSVLVVSHDRSFLRGIGVGREISLAGGARQGSF